MRAHDLMTTRVQTVRPDETLERAAQLMWEHDCGSLPVVNRDGHVVAMLTDRDICMCAYTKGVRLSEIQVATAMSHRIYRVRPEDSVEEIERLMWATQIRRVPVTDERGMLLGILSLNDIARHVRELSGGGTHGWSTESEAGGVAMTLAAISERAPRLAG
jgi:CBS domain-containing protein